MLRNPFNCLVLGGKEEIDPFKEFRGELIKPNADLKDTMFLDRSEILKAF
ncbi:hypothetical protein N824_16695 [Pedobacter sp. V48]|nr:hypothetical protein N824_16695 [Pedobacter sp. V48]